MREKEQTDYVNKVFLAAILVIICLAVGCSQPAIVGTYQLEKADDYPLFVMHYHEAYDEATTTADELTASWACSLFAALGDEGNLLYGRNFDWDYSPAMLLFTYPTNGYRSVSMVNLEFLGVSYDEADGLRRLVENSDERLRRAPWMPIDGMNEMGLAVGMAAVPYSADAGDGKWERIGSLGIMRVLLDRAANVEEALELMRQHRIDFGGGPPVHYLIADGEGKAALVEYGSGGMYVIANEEAWLVATNFLLEGSQNPRQECWRYQSLAEGLESVQGKLNGEEGMRLLATVAQGSPPENGTQWSVIYMISQRAVWVVMGREYENVLSFTLEESE